MNGHRLCPLRIPFAALAVLAAFSDVYAQDTPRPAEHAFGADEFALIDASRRKGEDDGTLGGGETTTPAMLTAEPVILDFGDLEVGLSTDRMLTLINVGGEFVEGALSVPEPFTVAESNFALEPQTGVDVTVTFTATERGTFQSSLDATIDASLALEVPLLGRAIAPVLKASPDIIDFRTVAVGDFRPRRVRIENVGELPLQGEASIAAPFILRSDAVYSLGPGAATFITVEYRPLAAGEHAETLELSGGGGTAIQLMGRAADEVGQVRGQITDARSTGPVPCAALAFEDAGGFITVATADANGVFLTEALPRGVYGVTIYAPGYERPTMTLNLAQGLIERRFELQPRTSEDVVRGVVGDAVSGALLGGVHVRVFQNQTEIDSAYTCANGAYEVRVADKSQSLGFVIDAPGFETGSFTELFEPPFDGPINFVLLAENGSGAAIAGRVTTASSDAPIRMATVTATARGISHTVFTRIGGIYTLPSVPQGEYTLRVSASAHLAADDLLAAAFETDEPAPTDIALVAGIDGIDPVEGDGETSGCSATAIDAPRTIWDLLVLAAAFAFLVRFHSRSN